ncbi:hypothetical protein DLJ53_14670 [Acuticoccus sediminis]|uniref:Small integral membrane protein n=1 Tax=Acuticoccus sediminis TaxID=2184697 RepID=A0A8B2NLM8_9HYPH|nr:hypothetical protein DLJ53_14670 [Acuticoccus sediminis]
MLRRALLAAGFVLVAAPALAQAAEPTIAERLGLGWMAWTWQTAVFFASIAAALLLMTGWELVRPGGHPRDGALGLRTTRGDRLFISLLAAAYIHLGWLAVATGPLWIASIIAVVVAIVVFLVV